jgi:hypothetical protein
VGPRNDGVLHGTLNGTQQAHQVSTPATLATVPPIEPSDEANTARAVNIGQPSIEPSTGPKAMLPMLHPTTHISRLVATSVPAPGEAQFRT